VFILEDKQTMLAKLSTQMGIPEDKIFESFTRSEYSYGVTTAIVTITIFWIAVWAFRKALKMGATDAGITVGILGGVIMVITLSIAANAVHHIMSPESYAIEKVYKVAIQGDWDPIEDD
jgi:hypothetical protein